MSGCRARPHTSCSGINCPPASTFPFPCSFLPACLGVCPAPNLLLSPLSLLAISSALNISAASLRVGTGAQSHPREFCCPVVADGEETGRGSSPSGASGSIRDLGHCSSGITGTFGMLGLGAAPTPVQCGPVTPLWASVLFNSE